MFYGLQASKDVKLSCIGRGLQEARDLRDRPGLRPRDSVQPLVGQRVAFYRPACGRPYPALEGQAVHRREACREIPDAPRGDNLAGDGGEREEIRDSVRRDGHPAARLHAPEEHYGRRARRGLFRLLLAWRVRPPRRNITRVSKRLFGVPDFHYYALADGIARLFNRCGRWCRQKTTRGMVDMQQELPLFASG